MAGYMFLDTFYPDVKGIYYEQEDCAENLEFCGLLTNDGIEACCNNKKALLGKEFPEWPILSDKKDVLPKVNDYFVKIFLQPPFFVDNTINKSEWEKYLTPDKMKEIRNTVFHETLSPKEGKFFYNLMPFYGLNELALMFSRLTNQKNLEREKCALLRNKAYLIYMFANLCREQD